MKLLSKHVLKHDHILSSKAIQSGSTQKRVPCAPLILSAVIAAAALMTPSAQAQLVSGRTVRIVVGDAAGGSPDTLGRLLAQKMAESLGQAVVVENKPGASGILAAETVAKASTDGHTLLVNTTSLWAILPSIKKSLSYDAERSFVPITLIATTANVLAINANHPARSVSDLVAYGKANPGKLNFASAGVGSPAHLAGEMLGLYADLKMTHLAYKGAGLALLDVIGGVADFIITSPVAAGPHVASGKVRLLATSGAQVNPALPNLPPISATIAGYDITQSWGMSAPAGTPEPTIRQLHAELVKALRQPDVHEKIKGMGATPVGNSIAEFTRFMADERKRLAEVITRRNIPLMD
ncbi:MAG: tripartite tricarboxylate transporter substrate binding protein [Betaproteobacteria bacterium]|nr:tripartite tricarboxylate transporter substrate binding protein [Betaproteobacteria bacterium]